MTLVKATKLLRHCCYVACTVCCLAVFALTEPCNYRNLLVNMKNGSTSWIHTVNKKLIMLLVRSTVQFHLYITVDQGQLQAIIHRGLRFY